MFKLIISLILAFGMALTGISAGIAQNPDQQRQEKEMQQKIDEEVEKYADNLKLADWQVFYVDSILNHDYRAMQAEFIEMNKSKVSNTDYYLMIQDKWMEQIYNSFHKFLDADQWAKYLKTGASKEKKARDKRAAKRNGK